MNKKFGEVKPIVEGQRWSYDVLLDVNQDLKRQLNIQSVPFTVVVDTKGKIAFTHSGYVDGDEFISFRKSATLASVFLVFNSAFAIINQLELFANFANSSSNINSSPST